MKPKDVLPEKSKGIPQPLSKFETSIGAVKAKGSKKITGTKSAGGGFRLAEQSSNIESRPAKGVKKHNPCAGEK